ncbi:MAG: anion transporter [Sandaracinaceae bacterium]
MPASTPLQPLGIALFIVAYLLVSLRRLGWLGLDRPAGALVGAVLFVATGILTPEDALGAVDPATLLLLFAVMGAGAFLAIDGFFESAEALVLSHVRTPKGLLAAIVWGAGALSALVTNDAVCVLGTPFVLRLAKRMEVRPLPLLLALATSANTGSVATLVGNPQNMLCASLGGLAYRDHLVLMLPVALVGLALNHGILRASFRRALDRAPIDSPALGERRQVSPRARLSLGVIGLTVIAYTAGTDLPWTAAAALVVLFLVHRRDAREIWPRIDWSLLVFFAGLFVVVRGLEASGGPTWLFARFPLADLGGEGLLGWSRVAALFLFGANLVSNVPFILVVREQMATLPDPRLGWEMLAMASTFAGNLTLLGSAANVIVAEGARDEGGFSFLEYLRVGAPVALATTAFGVVWLVLVAG